MRSSFLVSHVDFKKYSSNGALSDLRDTHVVVSNFRTNLALCGHLISFMVHITIILRVLNAQVALYRGPYRGTWGLWYVLVVNECCLLKCEGYLSMVESDVMG